MWKNVDPFIGILVGGIIVGIGFALHTYFTIPETEPAKEIKESKCVQHEVLEARPEVWLWEMTK